MSFKSLEERSPFKAGNGQLYLRQIFYEFNNTELDVVLYTLKEYDIEVDGKLIPSLSKLYIGLGDVSEYEFANKYFYNYRHWRMISEANWFKDYIGPWREELTAKKMAEALNQLVLTAKGESRDAFQANKYLLDKGWLAPRGSKGRPTKESIKKEAELLFKEKDELADDFDRLVVNLDTYRK